MSVMKRLQANKQKQKPAEVVIPVPLEAYPNLAAILCGYVDGEGVKHGGGSVLLILGNTGEVTASCSPADCDESFWTIVDCQDDFFAGLEGALEANRGSWRTRGRKK